MPQQLRERITKRRQKLANPWSFWDNSWSSLGITPSWSPFYASSGTSIWALYTKCSFQVYSSTGAKGKIPAFS
jgi:hypothetical protein